MVAQRLVRALDILGYISMLVLIPLWVVGFLMIAAALWLADLLRLRSADEGMPGCLPQAVMAVMLLLSLGYLGWAAVDAVKSSVLMVTGAETIGVVSATPTKRYDRYAIISYTVDGQLYTVTPSSAFGTSLQVGEAVPVCYDPASPGRAAVGSFNGLWGQPIMLIGMGLLCGGAAWHLFRDTERGLGIQR